jgi:hypothetical protein
VWSRASVDAVTNGQAAQFGRAVRALLLLVTVFGLAAMHTLGHAGMRMDTATSPRMSQAISVMTVPGAPLIEAVAAASLPCDSDHCTDEHGAMNGWSICLAVLGGLAVFALLAALSVAVWADRTRLREATAAEAASRAPPIRRPGLTMASTAVLRI